MKTILIVLNYNDFKTCERLLNNIKNFSDIDKIIVVDNNSTDNSFEKLKSYNSDKVECIKTDNNGGYAYGNNYGIKYALDKYNPEFIIISNPDIEFEEEIINVMENQLINHKDLAAVNPKIYNLDGTKAVANWSLPTFRRDLLSLSIVLSKLVDKFSVNKDTNKFIEDNIEYNDVLSGCFFMMKADAIKRVHFFDERTFLYCEERILAHKIKSVGLKQGTVNNISCIHAHSESINKNISSDIKKYKILFESRKIYYKYYLNLNKFNMWIFQVISKISLIEKYLLSFIRKLRRN